MKRAAEPIHSLWNIFENAVSNNLTRRKTEREKSFDKLPAGDLGRERR
jgi:hypothetical protein